MTNKYNLNETLAQLQKVCEFPVRCIYCGKIVMYTDPTHHIGQQLPDMLCISCKRRQEF